MANWLNNSKYPLLILLSTALFVLLWLGAYTLTKEGAGHTKPVFSVLPDTGNIVLKQLPEKISKEGQHITDGFFNPGFSKYRWWVLLELNAQEKSWLQIANPHINYLRIYQQQWGEWQEAFVSGDYYPYEQRLLDDTDFWFPVDTGSTQLLIRVDKEGESLNVPIRLVSANQLHTYLGDRNLFYGIFMGWVLMLLIMNLFLAISLKDQLHWLYILYVLCSFCWIYAQWGLGFKHIWPEATDFTSKSRPFFSNLAFLFLLELTARFFTAPNAPRLYASTIRITQLLLLISSVGMLFTNIPTSSVALRYGFLTTMNIIWLVSMLIILLFIWKGYKQRKELAIYFLAAIGFFAVYIVMLLLSQYSLGTDAVYFINRYGSPVGFLGESTILSFGISQRYNYFRKEKEEAMQALEKEKRDNADRIIATQEEERSRLARELHDGLGGLLGGIRIGAHHRLKPYPEEQQWIAEQIDQAVNDLRSISHDLMPAQLEELGLNRTLHKTIERWDTDGQGLAIKYNAQLSKRYPLRIEAALYRIILELMHNVKKHAFATELIIELWEEERTHRLTLLVQDDGTGFDKEKAEGLGWKSIKQRVRYLNGQLNLDTNTSGTTVIIEIPIEKES
jgi:signal transduction histidine kinase